MSVESRLYKSNVTNDKFINTSSHHYCRVVSLPIRYLIAFSPPVTMVTGDNVSTSTLSL